FSYIPWLAISGPGAFKVQRFKVQRLNVQTPPADGSRRTLVRADRLAPTHVGGYGDGGGADSELFVSLRA
ncbi:MAG: hypothetical protein WCT12_30715, partial [Verrucomicrobiota bacterium]